MKEMKIGFMAQAIATGLIASKAAAGSRMCACAGNFDKLCRNAEKKGIVPLRTAEEVIENSDFVILAVKPYMVEAVVEPIKGRPDMILNAMRKFWSRELIISVQYLIPRFRYAKEFLYAKAGILFPEKSWMPLSPSFRKYL